MILSIIYFKKVQIQKKTLWYKHNVKRERELLSPFANIGTLDTGLAKWIIPKQVTAEDQ